MNDKRKTPDLPGEVEITGPASFSNVAVLVLQHRPGGGLRVHSPTHPGLILSHSNCEAVIGDILPVLREMGFVALSGGTPPPPPPPPPPGDDGTGGGQQGGG